MVWKEQESNEGFWSPKKEGEELEGVIYRKYSGEFGDEYEIENEKGKFTTPSHRVLQAKMSNVQVGDKVKIVFIKEDLPKVKGQNGAKIYKVFIDKIEEEKIN